MLKHKVYFYKRENAKNLVYVSIFVSSIGFFLFLSYKIIVCSNETIEVVRGLREGCEPLLKVEDLSDNSLLASVRFTNETISCRAKLEDSVISFSEVLGNAGTDVENKRCGFLLKLSNLELFSGEIVRNNSYNLLTECLFEERTGLSYKETRNNCKSIELMYDECMNDHIISTNHCFSLCNDTECFSKCPNVFFSEVCLSAERREFSKSNCSLSMSASEMIFEVFLAGSSLECLEEVIFVEKLQGIYSSTMNSILLNTISSCSVCKDSWLSITVSALESIPFFLIFYKIAIAGTTNGELSVLPVDLRDKR